MSRDGVLARLAARFDPSTLVGHFVLGRSVPIRPAGWDVHSLEGWHLASESTLPVLDLVDADGMALGWILGHPLELGRGVCSTPMRAPSRMADPDIEVAFERWLFAHAGPFVAVLLRPVPLLFIDPFGSLPVLFDCSLELVSSSPFLLTEGGVLPDSDVAKAIDIVGTGSWFILGTTPHGRAERLIPNHLLDLGAWTTRRHWPAGPIEPGDPEMLIAAMANAIDGALLAAAHAATPNVSLTSGADSRCLLACAREYTDRLRYFTVPFPDRSGDTDKHTAPRIAARFGLRHRTLPWVRPTQADVDRYLYQTGCLVGEMRGREAGPTYAQLGGDAPYVSGVGTITARPAEAMGLTPSGAERSPTDAAWLLGYFGFPALPELERRANRWLAEAPPLDPHNLRVLYHMEMRYGCWGGALAVGYPDACTHTIYPFGQRAVAEAIFGLPLEARLAGRARHDATALRWPELLDIPINHPTRRATTVTAVRRASELPGGVVRRLRRYGRRLAVALGVVRTLG